ncbi:MAG: DNA-binding beta-propeller fold protein YncE, partial [Myxococcota bacterium]
ATNGCTTQAAHNGTTCDDGDPCTVDDACNNGACVAGGPKPCVTESCEVATCQAGTGACIISSADDGANCNDGDACTTDATCTGGVCGGSQPVECAQPNNPCEVALCTSFGGACTVFPRPNGASCDDGDLCTSNDSCNGGSCAGNQAVTCAASSDCLVYRCEPSTGGCEPLLAEDGTTCDDGDDCIVGESCLSGVCESGAPSPDCCASVADCDDGSVCTIDACEGGRCRHTASFLTACLGRIVVAGQADGELTVLDAQTLAPVPGAPVAILGNVNAVSASGRQQVVFVAVPDSATGQILAVDPYQPGQAVPGLISEISGGLWVSVHDAAGLVVVVHADGELETFDTVDGAFVSASAPLPVYPGRPALDPQTSRLYVPSDDGHLSVISLEPAAALVPMTPWAVAGTPIGAAYDATHEQLFLADPAKDGLRVVGAQHGAGLAGDALTGFGAPAGMAIDDVRGLLYAAFPEAEVVRVFDLATLVPSNPPAVAISPGPVAVDVDPLTGRVYIVSGVGETLHVLDGDTLNPVAGSPVSVAAGPVDVSVQWNHVGRIVINEVMVDPVGPDLEEEWIELHNPSDTAVDITGWTLQAIGGSHQFVGTPQIPAGGHLVLCRAPGAAGLTCGATYDGIELNDAGETLVLIDSAGSEVDRANLALPITGGETLALRHPGYNGERRYSFDSTSGTPGTANSP